MREVEREAGQRLGPVLRTAEADAALGQILDGGELPEAVAEVARGRAWQVVRGHRDVRLLRFLFKGAGYYAARGDVEAARAVERARAAPVLEAPPPSLTPETIARELEGAAFLQRGAVLG